MTESAIDRATFDELEASVGADFIRELIATFLADAPVMLDELRAALAAGDTERFRRTAHTLKSNGNTFGALMLAALARELELDGIARADTRALDALAAEYSRVAAALSELSRV